MWNVEVFSQHRQRALYLMPSTNIAEYDKTVQQDDIVRILLLCCAVGCGLGFLRKREVCCVINIAIVSSQGVWVVLNLVRGQVGVKERNNIKQIGPQGKRGLHHVGNSLLQKTKHNAAKLNSVQGKACTKRKQI